MSCFLWPGLNVFVGGLVQEQLERGSDDFFTCHEFGSDVNVLSPAPTTLPIFFGSRPRSGLRMNSQNKRITRSIYIDSVLLH